MKALSIDDEKINLALIEEMAKEIDLEVVSFIDPTIALNKLQNDIQIDTIDLFFVDYKMPELNGIELIKQIRAIDDSIPIIMITSVKDDPQLKLNAIDAGATEFLNKPLNIAEFKSRVTNLLQLRKAHTLIRDRAKLLEYEIYKATTNIRTREQETLEMLGRTADFKDSETGTHIRRVAHYAKLIAQLSKQDEEFQDIIFRASPLHDIGKIGISDTILCKDGKLTEDEMTIVKQHPVIGFHILSKVNSKYLQAGAIISLTHHERYNGKGYPLGEKGDDIHVFGRIVAICDVFDALINDRIYKEAWPPVDVIAYFEQEIGGHFDPYLAELTLKHIDDFFEINEKYKEPEGYDSILSINHQTYSSNTKSEKTNS